LVLSLPKDPSGIFGLERRRAMEKIKSGDSTGWAVSLLGCVVCIFPAIVAAGEEVGHPQSTSSVDDILQKPIVITATRTERSVTEVAASVTVIDADEISRHFVESPEALLKNEAGVDLAITPGGGVDRIVLRGIPEGYAGNTTQYLLNGMPVDPIQISTNRSAWHLVSAKDIERLEVVRGPATALYGANAMGGVINIITKRGAGDPFMRIDLEGGSHNGHAAACQLGGSFGDFDLHLSAQTESSDGYRPIQESAWGGDDYDLSERESKGSHLNANLSYWPSQWQQIRLGVYRYEQEDDWLGGHPNHRSDSKGTATDFAYRYEFSNYTQLTFKLLTLNNAFDVYSDNNDEDIPEDPLVLIDQYEDRTQSTNAELQLDLQPMEGHSMVLGASYGTGTWELNGTERYRDYPNWTPYMKGVESQVEALFMQDEIDLGDQLTLILGGRYDQYRYQDIQENGSEWPDYKDSVFTPRAGLNYRFNPAYSLYVSAGKGYIPANPALMYRSSNRWIDNEALEPEYSTSWEIGLNFNSFNSAITGNLAIYRTDYKDRISPVEVTEDGQPCQEAAPCRRQYQNISAIRVHGAELTLNGRFSEQWRPFFNYTLTAAEILENESDPQTEGNAPTYTPRYKANLGLSYENNQGFDARVAGRYVSTRYRTERHHDWSQLDNFFVVDAKLMQSFHLGGKLPDIELSLAVNNLFDETYSEWNNEMADGRNGWLGLSAAF
jgi:iron complex outermembrane receptor protein